MLGAREAEEVCADTGEFLSRWLLHARGRVRATTFKGYESLVRLHAMPVLANVPLSELRPLDLEDLYARLLSEPGERGTALSAATVRNLHRVLVLALSCAVRWGLLERNPARAAQGPRPRRPELAAVDQALAARILEAARGTVMEVPAALAMWTGMRRGEILGLRWADIDPGDGVAHVKRTLQVIKGVVSFEPPKTPRSRRSIVLPTVLGPYLERQRADQARRRAAEPSGWADLDLVVDGGGGRPLNPDTLSSAWVRFCRQAGFPGVRFHDLRHAHATLMLLKGIHPKVVSERLGHASIAITLDVYSHVLPSMQTEAARAIDELFRAS
jgi:integrase